MGHNPNLYTLNQGKSIYEASWSHAQEVTSKRHNFGSISYIVIKNWHHQFSLFVALNDKFSS